VDVKMTVADRVNHAASPSAVQRRLFGPTCGRSSSRDAEGVRKVVQRVLYVGIGLTRASPARILSDRRAHVAVVMGKKRANEEAAWMLGSWNRQPHGLGRQALAASKGGYRTYSRKDGRGAGQRCSSGVVRAQLGSLRTTRFLSERRTSVRSAFGGKRGDPEHARCPQRN